VTGEGSVPAQLPADVRAFTVRDAELAALDALLPQPAGTGGHPAGPKIPVVCAVTGPGGVGKTALVVRWSHRVRDQFPDGQLHVNLRGYDPDQPVTSDAALAGLLYALGAGPDIPAGLEARAAVYRSLLDGRRVLVVLDNAVSAAQVRPLLPGTPDAMTVITSRDQMAPLAVEGALTLRLDPLVPAEAHALLTRRLGAGRIAAEPAAAEQITAACAGLPLALVIVAARAATNPAFPLSVVAAELTSAGHRLNAMTAGDTLSDVRTAFSWSYQELPALAARVWRQFSLHPGPDLTAPAAASLTGLPLAAVRPLLSSLTQANLLAEHQPGRYAFHDLLREYATELTLGTDTAPVRQAAVRRLLDYYVHTAHAAARRLNPSREPVALPLTRPASGADPGYFDDGGQARDWFTAEHHALLSAQRLADDAGQHVIAWQLAWSLSTYLRRAGLIYDRISAWQTALAAAERLGHPAAQAQAHRVLGQSLVRAGADAGEVDTHLETALTLSHQAGDRTGEADTYATLDYVWSERGEHDRALHYARRGLACYETLGNQLGQAACLNSIGLSLIALSRYQEAIGWCERALAIQQKVGSPDSGATLDSLGVAYYKLGDHGRAMECYRQALVPYRVVGDRFEEASTLANLGDAQLAAGQQEEARASWHQALGIFTALGHPVAAGVQARLAQLSPA
jgi:tetratricopeptide (TPR) repeat protein